MDIDTTAAHVAPREQSRGTSPALIAMGTGPIDPGGVSQQALVAPSVSPSRYSLTGFVSHRITMQAGGEPPQLGAVEHAVGVLQAHGVATRQDVLQWMQEAYKKDRNLAMASACLGELGYGASMTAVVLGLINIPELVKDNTSLYGTLTQTGSGRGAWIGGLISVATIGTSLVASAMQAKYQHAGASSLPLAQVGRWHRAASVLAKAACAVALNVLKNLPRIPAPAIQHRIEKRWFGKTDGLIDLRTFNLTSLAIDALGGMAAEMVFRRLELWAGDGVPYIARLLGQSDGKLRETIRRSSHRPAAASAVDVPSPASGDARKRSADLVEIVSLLALPVLAVVIFTSNVSLLFAASQNIVTDEHQGRSLPPGRVDPAVMAHKEAVAVHLMGLTIAQLRLLLPAAEWVIEKVLDAAVECWHEGKLPSLSRLRKLGLGPAIDAIDEEEGDSDGGIEMQSIEVRDNTPAHPSSPEPHESAGAPPYRPSSPAHQHEPAGRSDAACWPVGSAARASGTLASGGERAGWPDRPQDIQPRPPRHRHVRRHSG